MLQLREDIFIDYNENNFRKILEVNAKIIRKNKVAPQEEYYMSTVQYNFIFFICIFPVWALNFNLELNLLLIILAVLSILLLINNFIYKKIIKNKNLLYFYLALVFTYGIDKNL